MTPSDALVTDVPEFRCVLKKTLDFASQGQRIVTLGIRPTRPETGYGYIAASAKLPNSEICSVESFREKPTLHVAKQYISSGNYYWNSGIFIWNISTIVNSIRKFAPDLAEKMDKMSESFYTSSEVDVVNDIFPTCEKIFIDYAIMEKG